MAILDLAKVVANDGLLMVYGTLAPEPTPFPIFESWGQAAQLKPFKMMGYSMFSIANDPASLKAATGYLFDKLDSGQLKPRIDRTFSLAEIADAHRYMEKGQQIGKIVVRV